MTLENIFQSTPSPRRETNSIFNNFIRFVISIHSLPKEGDYDGTTYKEGGRNFNPLPPQGGRRCSSAVAVGRSSFQSTPSPRRETWLDERKKEGYVLFQSTPSPRRETAVRRRFSLEAEFQSTPSPRRETPKCLFIAALTAYFNPLPPQGGRHWERTYFVQTLDISIHSLPKEGDSIGVSR